MDIGIIKLGAKGDVVRTLPIIKKIKGENKEAKVTLITRENSRSLLEKQPFIDELKTLPYTEGKSFDLLYNFDIDDDATALAQQITADEKKGFYAEDGFVQAFNIGAEYYLNTLFDDEIKKSNKKTYQEMMSKAADISPTNENVLLVFTDNDKKYADDFFSQHSLDKKKTIGIHMGASPRWPSKVWHNGEVKEFINKATQKGYQVLVFGGPDEAESHKKLSEELDAQGISFARNNASNTDREFASLVNNCAVMVCSDSFSLHVALSCNVKTIGLFFCTSPDEVEGYDLLTKKISPQLDEFFPQRMDEYNEELTRSISHEDVLASVEKVINANE